MSLTEVQQALETKVQATLSDWVLEGENGEVTKPTRDRWAKVFFVPGPVVGVTLGQTGRNECYGFTQVDLKYPVNTGDATVRVDYNTLYAAFPVGSWLTLGGQVVEITACSRSQGRKSDSWYTVSVTIAWYALLERGDSMASAAVRINFGGDMSASRVSQVIPLNPYHHISVQFAWTDDDDPDGVLSFEVSEHGDPSGEWETIDLGTEADYHRPGGQSDDGHLFVDDIKTTAAYGRWRYTRTSGGTGDVLSDGSTTASALPLMNMKE